MNHHTFYWRERWSHDKIGFHKKQVNPTLLNYFSALNLNAGDTVLVPLCGKSLDMFWLMQQGFQVVGVELSELAVEAFFHEQQLSHSSVRCGSFKKYTAPQITLFQGDIFELTPDLVEACTAYYDRAALIALPLELRQKYVAKVSELLKPGAQGLVSTIDYQCSKQVGPPFNVGDDEFRALYAQFSISLLSKNAHAQPPQSLADFELSQVMEYVYHLS